MLSIRLRSVKRGGFCLLLTLFILLVNSCDYIDPLGLLYSSDVNSRFKLKDSLSSFSAPPVSDSNNFTFLVISDVHYDNKQLSYLKSLEAARSKYGFEFVIINGDIVQAGYRYSFDLVKEDAAHLSVPYYPVIGNHDIYNGGFRLYKEEFGRTVYNFKVGKSHFIILDTANGDLGELQKSWFEERLAEGGENIFLFSHYSPTDKEMQSPTAMPYPEQSYYLFDKADRYNVDYFICGHLHRYEEKEIRGVKYVMVNAAKYDKESALLVTIKGTTITHRPLSGIFN